MKVNVFKIRLFMAEQSLTGKKLAMKSGVSRQTISYILSGKSCTTQVAYKIAVALGKTLEQIAAKEELDG